ncbi:MAG: M24 family metallopeptidase [Solirubrobacteraceae bacterium]
MSTRAQRLTAALDKAGVDLVMVTNLTNIRYLTGFTGSNALVLVGAGVREFLSDFRYTEQAQHEVPGEFSKLTVAQDLVSSVVEHLPNGNLTVGYEAEHMTVAALDRARELFPARVQLRPTTRLVETLRLIKDEQEIKMIEAATKLADDAFRALLEGGLKGRTERELALTLEHDMRLRGASGPSFDSIIAAGAHAALPHAQPRDVKVTSGQLVVIDWGAKLGGYCSDCTRTVAVGEPDSEAREAYELVLGAQVAGVAQIGDGGDCRAIDKLVRDVIYGAGHAEHYGHGLGHGVGLDIHEAPTLSFRSSDTLRTGQVVTVEPGVYVPGRFGVRIEDLMVVGEVQSRVLTGVSKDLQIVD